MVGVSTGMKNSRWISLLVLCTGFLLIVVDMTIVNVAVPSIPRDLGFSQAGLAWVLNAYLIAFGGLLLLAGRLGDLVGRKRVFRAREWAPTWTRSRARRSWPPPPGRWLPP